MRFIHFIGIDVSKKWFDAVEHANAAKPERFLNSSAGFAAFAQRFGTVLPETLVVLEATGGYETALIATLVKQGVAVHRADPLTAKHFLRSLRLRAKTDQLDAIALARYGAERYAQLALCQVPDAAQEELNALLARRSDLVAMRVQEQNRFQHPRYALLKKSLTAVMATLKKEIASLEARIQTLIEQSPTLKEKLTLMTSVIGVGTQTAYTLIACMPELGAITRRQAASLAGCAPHPKDSGKTRGYRSTGGGRHSVKRALFMAAMAARRFHPELSDFYKRLVENGKKKMVALTAVMRKIITILNAKLRDYNQLQKI